MRSWQTCFGCLILVLLSVHLTCAWSLDLNSGPLADRARSFEADNALFYQDQVRFAQLIEDRLANHIEEIAYLNFVNNLKNHWDLKGHESEIGNGPFKFYNFKSIYYFVGNLSDFEMDRYITELTSTAPWGGVHFWSQITESQYEKARDKGIPVKVNEDNTYYKFMLRRDEYENVQARGFVGDVDAAESQYSNLIPCKIGPEKGKFACAELISRDALFSRITGSLSLSQRKPIQDIIFRDQSHFQTAMFSAPLSESKNSFFEMTAHLVSPELTQPKLTYSSLATSILFLNNGRFQCYSGTMGYLFRARQTLGYSEFENRRFVVIFTLGHMLPGYIENRQGSDYLVGLETTVNGRGVVQFGPLENLNVPIRVVDANLLFHFESVKNQLNGRQVLNLSQQILSQTAEHYGINLSRLEQRVSELGAKASDLSELGFGASNPFAEPVTELAQNVDEIPASNYTQPSNSFERPKLDLPKPNWFPTSLAIGVEQSSGNTPSPSASIPPARDYDKEARDFNQQTAGSNWWQYLYRAIDAKDTDAIKKALASKPSLVADHIVDLAAILARSGQSELVNTVLDVAAVKKNDNFYYQLQDLKAKFAQHNVTELDKGAALSVILSRVQVSNVPVDDYLDCLPCLKAFFDAYPDQAVQSVSKQQNLGYPLFTQAAQKGAKVEVLDYLYEKLQSINGSQGINIQSANRNGDLPYCIAKEHDDKQGMAWFQAHKFYSNCPYKIFGLRIWQP